MICVDVIFKHKPTKFFFAGALLLALLMFGNMSFGQTNTWDGSSSNNWNTSGNWSLNIVPTAAHNVVININAAILVDTNPTINSLTISNSSTVLFTSYDNERTITINNTGSSIALGSSLTLRGSTGNHTRSMSILFTGTNRSMSIAGTLILTAIGEGTIYNATNSLTTVTGTIINDGNGGGTVGVLTSSANNLSFLSGGNYQHALNGGTIPTATWDAASICSVIGIIGTAPSGFGQIFGNFIWNCPGQTVSIYSTNGNITVKGNFTLIAGIFNLNNGVALRTLTINGNYIQTGGTFDFNIGTSGTSNMFLSGNMTLTSSAGSMTTNGNGAPNGVITFNGSGIQTMSISNPGAAIWTKYSIPSGKSVQLQSNITLSSANLASEKIFQGEMIVNGTLKLGNFTVSQSGGAAGASVFTVNSGANLITANSGGISGSVSSTNMTATYSSGANYEFQGASTGTLTTTPIANTVNNLVINNSSGVILTSNTTVSGILNLTSGILTTGTNTLIVANNATSAVTGGSVTNFVNGPLIWQLLGGQTYIFPVGKGATYLPFGLTNIIGTAPSLRVEAFTTNSGGTFSSPLVSLSNTEYWVATVTAGSYTNGSVSLNRQISLSGLNAIGRSSTLSGDYSNLNGTVSGTSIVNSDNTGNALGYFVMAAKRSITTGAIVGSPFCAGAAVSVPFNSIGTFNTGNVFTAQLSNASGNFSVPVTIGTYSGTTAVTIPGTFPAGTVSGSGYRIRVISSNPVVTGSDNGIDISVITIPAQPSLITGNSTPCQNSVQTYSVANVAGVTYTWTFPAGWTQTSGGTTNLVTVIAGTNSGNVQVTPSTSCGTGTPGTLSATVSLIPVAPTTNGSFICVGSTATLSASGTIAGEKYKWYDAATAGNLLKTGTNYADNTYVTPVVVATTNYWVSIVNSGGCESSRTQVAATLTTASPDLQSLAGTDSWIGHVYDGMNFAAYYGTYTENESFNQSFGGDQTCFALTSSLGTRSIYTETFSAHYRMNSTKRGLYIADLGSDDGIRLTVDGTLLYNNWVDQVYTSHPRILMNLNGASSLVYDYYSNSGPNQAVFQNLTLVMSNTLTTGTSQSINVGGTWSTISGNVFGTLPTGIALSGTGYQWTYSTTPAGTRTIISGATGATYTPSATVAPFNIAGTYYIYRNAILSSANNVSPNPYVATNESNMAVLTISNVPAITTSVPALSGFSYAVGFGPSGEKSFTVSGTNLPANLTVTPSANFEISTGTGAAFVASSFIHLTVNSGNVPTTTIYVRLKSGLPISTIPVENVVCASNGLTSKNVACSGSVTSIPVILSSVTSLTDFSYPFTGGPSSQQTFTVSGNNLVANVTVTPSASFEISTTSGSGFKSTPLTLAQTGGTLTGTTIYVRMKNGLGIGGYSESIVSTSTSATPLSVTCNGTVIGSNTITISKSSLSGFIYTVGNGPSASQSFTVSGTLLTKDIVISPAPNYEISLSSGGSYQSTPISLTPSGQTVNTTPIYVRLKAGLAVGVYPAVNIPVSSIGAITKSVGCSGAVVNTATVMVSKTTLSGFGYMSSDGGPSGEQSFTVSGASLSANITVTPPANYQISLSSGSGFIDAPSTLTLTQSAGVVGTTTIYVRLKAGLSSNSYNGVNVIVTSGTVAQNIACKGIVFVSPLVTAGGGSGPNCVGSTVNLTSVGADILNRFWQGPNSFYSTIQNPVLTNATTAMSGTYTVTGNVIIGGNVVTNGNFEEGNAGFGSSYVLGAQTASGLVPESTYDVVADPHSRHANFIACGDHTSGTGKQMVINGAGVAGVVIWSQSVPTIPGAYYEFTYWVQSVVAESPSQLQLYMNGVYLGPVYTADLATCSWKQFVYNANVGNNTSVNLELINQNTAPQGNDFALDDIVFQQILPATSSVDITVNPALPVSLSLAAVPNPTTTGTNVTFTATPTNGGTTPNYQWKVNGVNVANGSSPTYNSSTLSNSDIVSCVLTSSLSCTTGNPATSNTVIMTVSERVNYWMGTSTSTDWGTAANWTAGYVPAAGDDIEFATVANYGTAAKNDLYLDINRTIGSLIDATTKSTVIPGTKKLTVNRNLYLGSGAKINASALNSTIEFAGTLAQAIPAGTFYNDNVYDIIINNSNNVTLSGTMRLLHEITAKSGLLDATTFMPTVVYAGDVIGAQTIEMNRFVVNNIYNLTIYNALGVALATSANIYVPNDLTITRGILTVPAGATLTVDNSTKLDYRAPKPAVYPMQIDYWSCLVLKSNATSTGSFIHNDLFSGAGTVKVERFMSKSNNWHLYSSPMKDQSIKDFLKYNPEIPDVYDTIAIPNILKGVGMRDYLTSTDTWSQYFDYEIASTVSGSIGKGKGFNIRTYNDAQGTGTVDATGVPNLNNVNVALTRSTASTDKGWNCIGNPFTSAINIKDGNSAGFLNASNIANFDPDFVAIYMWDTNNITTSQTTPEFIVINNATSISSVQIGQGFFVKSKTGGGNVGFTKAMQSPNPGLTFKVARTEWPSIKIVAKDFTSSSSTEIKIIPFATEGLDPGYDAGMYKVNPGFALYSKLLEDNAIDFTLQCLPDQNLDKYVIPIGLDSKLGGEITFSAETINLPTGCRVVLEDRLTKRFTSLDLSGAKYTAFLNPDTKGTGRFFLHTSDVISSIGDQPKENESFKVYTIGKTIYVNGDVSENAKFYLYSINGKLLANVNAESLIQNGIDASQFPAGVYLLTEIDKNQRKSVKFILGN